MKNYSKKKVLHIINSLGDGGAEGVLYRLILATNRFCEHEVVCLGCDSKYGRLLKNNNINFITLNINSYLTFFLNIFKIFKILKQRKNYIIQTWLYHSDLIGGLIAKIAGCKKILWNIRTSELDFNSTKLRTYFVIRLCAFFSRYIPDKIIICSKRSIKIHRKIGFNNNFFLIENGFAIGSLNLKKRILTRSKLKIKKNDFIIGNVARFHPSKNHFHLLKLFLELNKIFYNIKLILSGTNIDKNNIKLVNYIKANKLQNKVILLGRRDNIFDIYKLFDLFVLVSKTEGFPNVLAEAMLSKVISCATDVGDSKYIVNDLDLMLDTEFSKHNLTVIKNLYMLKKNNFKKWHKKKIESQSKIIKNYSLDKMVQKYLYIWNKC